MKQWVCALVMVLLFAAVATGQSTPTPTPTPQPTPVPEPQSAEDFFNLAVTAFRNGDLSGAERHARTVVALENRNVEAHYLLGQVLLYKAAQRNRLLIDNPGLGSALLPSESRWPEGIPELEEAVSQFRIVIKLQPDNTSAWLLLATCLDNLGEEDEAISAYKQTINLDPISPTARDAWNNLGLLHMSLDRYKEAKFAFESALRIDPTFMPARVNLEKLRKKKPSLFR